MEAKNNPYSKLVPGGDKGVDYIYKPWNDESIFLVVVDESIQRIVTTLNSLILPERFTAIYHLDKKKMEYIFAVVDKGEVEFNRKFIFTIEGKQYDCGYGLASNRLLTLSQFCGRFQASATGFRNLLQFRDYMRYKHGKNSEETEESLRGEFEGKTPISFYVSGFSGFDENEIVNLSKHINFYLQYYDRRSASIVIHQIGSKDEKARQLQFIGAEFPAKITTKALDSFLLTLMDSALEAELRLQFIYYYQILEYSAFYYVKDSVKKQLLKIINAPDILCNSDKCISRILETVDDIRQEDETKIQKTVRNACVPEELWEEIKTNKTYFSQKHEFDGGFTIEPIVTEDMSYTQFATNLYQTICNSLKYIRNALVHGREKQFGKVITPTQRNNILLAPWVSIARRIAEHVIIYGY